MLDDFFRQEQKMAIRAMVNCCSESWQTIEQDTNIEPLIRKRPMTSLAIAAAGGLAAGYLLTPSRRRKHDHDLHSNGRTHEHHNLLALLERQLVRAIVPVLQTFAATATNVALSDIHKGYTNGQPPSEPAQASPPYPPVQL